VFVKKSQANKRRAIARKELLVNCPDGTSAPAAAVDSSIGTGEPSRRTSTSVSGAPSAEEQVGLLEVVGLSERGFALMRRIFGGGRVNMASVDELRLARKRLAAMPSKQIKVDSAGAHTASLSLAVQERVSALCQSGRFVERHVYDEHYRPMPKTALSTDADASDPGVLAGCPPPNMKASMSQSVSIRAVALPPSRLWSESSTKPARKTPTIPSSPRCVLAIRTITTTWTQC